jgi:nucleoside-diphosphate-sugar epimerase
MRTAFITGGSGFLGVNLIRFLLREGWDVVSFDLQPFNYQEQSQIRTVIGDIRNRRDLDVAMSGADVVVHCAAALPLNSKEEIFTVDVEGTRNVFEAAEAAKVARVVHISSTAVYGVPKTVDLTEEHELVGVGPYGNAKIAAEAIAENFRKFMTVAIIRPKSFIGPERLGVFSLLFDWASTGHNFPIPGKGHNLYQYLDVEDLCQAIHLCMTAPKSQANDTYNIGAESFGTFRDDFQSVLDAAGFGKKIQGMPVAPVLWALRILDKLRLSPLYPWVYETAVKDSYVSIGKAKRQLGWQPQFSNKDALLKNYSWYVKNRDHFSGLKGTTHRVAWKQGALRFGKVFFR